MANEDEGFRNGLTPEAEALRARLSEGGLAEAGEPGLDELIDLGLAQIEPFNQRYIDGDLRGAISEAAARLGRLAAVLASTKGEHKGGEEGGIRWVHDSTLATALISRACEAATSYVWTAHPADREARLLAASEPRDLRMIERGVDLRTVYPDTARARPGETAWATAVSAKGAEVRTAPPDFMRMVAIDGELAVVEDPASPPRKGTAVPAAYFVTHPGMVKVLERVYLTQWEAAEPWMGGVLRRPDGTFTTRRQRKILNYLRDGHPATWIQRALGISESTYRNEISRLYEGSGTHSLFTLGYWWCSDISAAERAPD